MSNVDGHELDLLVVGAGPTGIATGAHAKRAGLDVLLVDRGPLAAALVGFPSFMNFFTTRDLMEIAGVPLTIAHEKPTRREALTYYQAVAAKFDLPLALHEEVTGLVKRDGWFEVSSVSAGGERVRRARSVCLAQGYFHRPRRLDVPGESLDWVRKRYREPYGHYGEHVAVIGGGNSAIEAALELWRNNVKVTLVHRRERVKETVKYWLKPDFENRVAEGSITARMSTRVSAFVATDDGRREVRLESAAGQDTISADAAYVLIGYEPDVGLAQGCGVVFDPETLVPKFDPESCQSNIPGLYLAGTVQVGRDIGKLFIENSRVHAQRIVEHLTEAPRHGDC